MKCCGMTCCGAQKHIIYIVGQKDHKEQFLEHVLKIKHTSEPFAEAEVSHKGVSLLLQTCEVGDRLTEVTQLHSKMACGIIYISETDVCVNYENYILFVLMNKKSKQASDERVIVASVVDGDYGECKQGFDKLVDNLNKH